MSIIEWADKYRWLAPEEAARPGKYRFDVTPHLIWPGGPLEALDDPAVSEIVGRKSAQVAWTSGVLGNALGKWIDIDPSPILVLFPKAEAAKQYVGEKLEPMIEATPRLRKKVDLRSRKLQQRQDFKRFPGGFLKMVGSNSPASVKSTPVPRVAIEEPDDCNLNLRGQGDSIKLAKERLKTFRRSKILIGGTPTIKGLSAIDAELELSDKRVGLVPCHECGQEHALSFDNLHCDEDPEYQHEVYGKKRPEKTFYSCPHCGGIWDDNLLRIEENLSAAWQRLSGTYVENLPWLECAERYDRAHTFHYMDPPYWQTAGYGVGFPFENYERMADFMRRCKGKVMVSINDHPDIRRVFAGFHFETLDIRYTTTNHRQGKAEVSGELVIMNWEPGAFSGLFGM